MPIDDEWEETHLTPASWTTGSYRHAIGLQSTCHYLMLSS